MANATKSRPQRKRYDRGGLRQCQKCSTETATEWHPRSVQGWTVWTCDFCWERGVLAPAGSITRMCRASNTSGHTWSAWAQAGLLDKSVRRDCKVCGRVETRLSQPAGIVRGTPPKGKKLPWEVREQHRAKAERHAKGREGRKYDMGVLRVCECGNESPNRWFRTHTGAWLCGSCWFKRSA